VRWGDDQGEMKQAKDLQLYHGDFDSSVFPIPQSFEQEIIGAIRLYTTYPAAEVS